MIFEVCIVTPCVACQITFQPQSHKEVVDFVLQATHGILHRVDPYVSVLNRKYELNMVWYMGMVVNEFHHAKTGIFIQPHL